jgi:5-formyltetrahydrofolate cyclo-ligase
MNPKAELRGKLRAIAREHSAAERAENSSAICAQIRMQPAWREARAILFYHPTPDEPDIRPLIAEALTEGKITTLPRYSSEKGHYAACLVRDLALDLQQGNYGIHEPASECSIFDLKKLDLILVPGIGFALNGLRLGRGKGYYDRLLADTPAHKCGVAFDWQLAVEIPSEPHDIRLNSIVTPTRWHEVTGPRAA